MCALILAGWMPVLEAQDYVTAFPQTGEGILSFLRRFHLPATPDVVQQFRRLNGMSSTDDMEKAQSYRLPILRYTYNGQSIRSTLHIQSYVVAERIASYNKQLQQSGVRSDDFTRSNDLWVPWHLRQGSARSDNSRLVSSSQARPPRAASRGVSTSSGVRVTRPVVAQAPISTSKPVAKPVKSVTKIDYSRVKMEGRGTYPIFGDKYERVRLLDRQLGGFVYYIDGGHGGPDPGTQARYQNFVLNEDEYAYDIALRLARRLVLHGATVYLTVRDENDGIRDEWILDADRDEVFGDGSPMVGTLAERLTPRSAFVNERYDAFAPSAKAQRFLSVHVDAREGALETTPVDVHFLYHSDSPLGLGLSRILTETLRQKYAALNRPYDGKIQARDQLHVLKYAKAPAVLIETGNLRSPQDQPRLLNPENRQTLAEWLCDGLLREAHGGK